MDDFVDSFLAHHGIKGMKWGVRKSSDHANSVGEKKKLSKKQKIAIAGAAGGLLLGGIAVAVILHNKGNLKVTDLKPSKKAEEFVAKKFEEPLRPIFVSKTTKGDGYRYMGRGGIKDPSSEVFRSPIFDFERSGQREGFKRYGEDLEKIAVRFQDPKGRTDRASRPIYHDLIIPKDMAKDITSVDDVMKKVWPKISTAYDRLVSIDEKS